MILIILLTLSGVISLINMPLSEDPLVSPAGSSVIVIYPGANPSDMEELVVSPIEDAINAVHIITHKGGEEKDCPLTTVCRIIRSPQTREN